MLSSRMALAPPPPKRAPWTQEFRVLSFAATDHRPILAVFPLCEANPGLRTTFFRNFRVIERNRIGL